MGDHSRDSNDHESGASSYSNEGTKFGNCYCDKKASVVCLDCCYRYVILLCLKCSEAYHSGKLADIHHRITLRSQVTSQRVSYTQDDDEHYPSHKFSNRRYACFFIKERESCEGEATVACLDCDSNWLQLSCSTCDISEHKGSEAHHRRIRLHPVSTDDARGGGWSDDDDGECGDYTSRMEGNSGESYGKCVECRGEAVDACLDCSTIDPLRLCTDCDIKRHAKKLIATHCRIPIECFQPMKQGQKYETFDVPNNKIYVCTNPSEELNLCEGKATYVVLEKLCGDDTISVYLLCNYCCKQKVESLEDCNLDYGVVMLHYQDSFPNVEHENISMQQDSDEINLENNSSETTPQIAMEHQIRTTDAQRNTDETTRSDMIDQNSDNSIVREELGTTTQITSQCESGTVATGNAEELPPTEDSQYKHIDDSENSINATTQQLTGRQNRNVGTPSNAEVDDMGEIFADLMNGNISSLLENITDAQRNDEEVTQNSSDGRDPDHLEGSHYKCDRCERPAHSICMDCDRIIQRLCRQCHTTEHNTPALKRHLTVKIPRETTTTRTPPVNITDLSPVHDRYRKVLEYTCRQKHCTLHDALNASGIKRQTLIDRHGIAELRIVDEQTYNDLEKKAKEKSFRSKFTVKDFEKQCREELKKRREIVHKMKSEKKLLPFDIQAYKSQ